jgi:hypothetical protein
MVRFFARVLPIAALACALSACGTSGRDEASSTTTTAAALIQKPAPTCRRYGLCRGTFGLYQSYLGDDHIGRGDAETELSAH